MDTCICMAESLHSSPEIITTLSVGCAPKQNRVSLVAQTVKNLPAMQETLVKSPGKEDPLEKGMANHFSILAWKIPWMEETDGLRSWSHKELDTTEQRTLSIQNKKLFKKVLSSYLQIIISQKQHYYRGAIFDWASHLDFSFTFQRLPDHYLMPKLHLKLQFPPVFLHLDIS